MKRTSIAYLNVLIVALLLCLQACNTNDPEKEALRKALQSLKEKNQQDSLYISDLTSEMDVIYDQLDSMREMERRVKQISSDLMGGNLNVAEGGKTIDETMQEIQNKLEQSRNRIAQLESKLSKEGKEKQKYMNLVVQLRKAIEDKDANITSLQEQVQNLESQVKGLKLEYAVKQVEADSLQDVTSLQDETLNTVYYVIGSEKNLKKLNVLVNKKRGLKGQRDNSKFISIDRREQKNIKIGKVNNLKRIRLSPERPSNSYRLYEDGGIAHLEITDEKTFWRDKYLAIIAKLK